jgi:hypothetical protein
MLITLRVLAKNEAPKVQRVLIKKRSSGRGKERCGLRVSLWSHRTLRYLDLTQKGTTEQNGADFEFRQTNKHASLECAIHCHPQMRPSEFLERLCKSNRLLFLLL